MQLCVEAGIVLTHDKRMAEMALALPVGESNVPLRYMKFLKMPSLQEFFENDHELGARWQVLSSPFPYPGGFYPYGPSFVGIQAQHPASFRK